MQISAPIPRVLPVTNAPRPFTIAVGERIAGEFWCEKNSLVSPVAAERLSAIGQDQTFVTSNVVTSDAGGTRHLSERQLGRP